MNGNLHQRTDRIKQLGLETGAVVVGVADVAAFNEFVPEGHRPDDILPGAKSVVVAGGRGPTAGSWRCPDYRVMEITGYDFRENVAIHVMCDFIEREYGYAALQAPVLPTAGHRPPMSMMLAAVLAGLGTRSLAANIILNRGTFTVVEPVFAVVSAISVRVRLNVSAKRDSAFAITSE